MQNTYTPIQRKILTVSELTREIKGLLEQRFPFIWISGEISNVSTPVSGHCYFTLKDDKAQVSAVMFRGQLRNLTFALEHGMRVTGLGRISVYEPRGAYQVIFEYLEPQGVGALQLAFEQLKRRLHAEGLFDEARKKPLPFLPQRIVLITSLTGAVLHDMLQILDRRFPNLALFIIPVRVQGAGAEEEIAAAIGLLQDAAADVAILARGGGSLEDLQPFNSETVARAIAAARIPIVSAVGHETDYTIADFAADLRAPTPSAAAELVVPLKADLERRCQELSASLLARMGRHLQALSREHERLSRRLVHPARELADHRLRIDDLSSRLVRRAAKLLAERRQVLGWQSGALYTHSPAARLQAHQKRVEQLREKLLYLQKILINQKRASLEATQGKLMALSPQAILERGYSITLSLPEKAVVTDAAGVAPGRRLKIQLARGALTSRVEESG